MNRYRLKNWPWEVEEAFNDVRNHFVDENPLVRIDMSLFYQETFKSPKAHKHSTQPGRPSRYELGTIIKYDHVVKMDSLGSSSELGTTFPDDDRSMYFDHLDTYKESLALHLRVYNHTLTSTDLYIPIMCVTTIKKVVHRNYFQMGNKFIRNGKAFIVESMRSTNKPIKSKLLGYQPNRVPYEPEVLLREDIRFGSSAEWLALSKLENMEMV